MKILIWAAVVLVVFGFLWKQGYLARMATYLRETREELRKCTWPTWTELKGSTAVVVVATLILGVFTMLVDFIFTILIRMIT